MTNLNHALGEGSILVNQSANTWQETFQLAGDALVSSKRVTSDYTQQMIDAFNEFGPYMVLTKGVALAHARPSSAVLSTGLSLVTLTQGINFGVERFDPVRVVIGLAAIDHDSHIDLMAELADIIASEENVNSLIAAVTEAEVRSILG